MVTSLALFLIACDQAEQNAQKPIITDFFPKKSLVGSHISIQGFDFLTMTDPNSGLYDFEGEIDFNGVLSEVIYMSQDSAGKQYITTTVPEGASSGKIGMAVKGRYTQSTEEFTVGNPDYVAGVTVSTLKAYPAGFDLAHDGKGNLFVVNKDYLHVVKISSNGEVDTIWMSPPDPNREYPYGVAVDIDGNPVVSIEQSIRKIYHDRSEELIAGHPTEYGYQDGNATDARFNYPFGLTVDAEGNIYVADLLNCRIRKISKSGMVTTIAGNDCNLGNLDDPLVIGNPKDVTISSEGILYFTDDFLRKIDSYGNVTVLGSMEAGFNDGSLASAQFNGPHGLAVNASGELFICDFSNTLIRKITKGGQVRTVAGTSWGLKDGGGSEAQFGFTREITLDERGNLFVTQSGGLGGIRKITFE